MPSRREPPPPPPPGTVRLSRGDAEGYERVIMDFIQSYTDLNGYEPSVTEVAEHINRERITAGVYLKSLAEKGYIKRHPRTRAIILVKPE
jgi:SOS-response transcriptional repressor LexA